MHGSTQTMSPSDHTHYEVSRHLDASRRLKKFCDTGWSPSAPGYGLVRTAPAVTRGKTNTNAKTQTLYVKVAGATY